MKGLIIIGICTLILVSSCNQVQEQTKEKTLEEKYSDIQQEISQREYELYLLKRVASMYQMDLEAKKNDLTVEYKKLPNSEWVMRFEYNGSHFDSVEIADLMESVKVEKR